MLIKVYPLEEVFYFSKKLLYKYLFVCVFNCSVMSDSLQPYGLYLSDSSVHGIFQARILEWVAISYSRGSFWPRDQIISCISCIGKNIFYHFTALEAPINVITLRKIL